MAQFITVCPHCNSALQVQSEWIGQQVECPICHNAFVIPPPVQDRITPQTVESAPKKKKVIITLSIIIAALLGIGITAFAGEKRIAEELKPAKAQGIQFSDGNKTLVKCPGNVEEVFIPSCVTKIGASAFEGCKNLQSVNIPNSVTEIGNSAFWECKNLQSVNIPNSVTEIGQKAFNGVKSVKVADGNLNFYVDDSGVLIDRKNKKLLYCPWSISGNYTIPDSVTKIGNSAFRGCTNLQSVNIPNNVTEIGEWAFMACKNLQSVTIGNRVTYIAAGAFWGCKNLQSVNIPDSVTEIERLAFERCSNLRSVTIPQNCKVGFRAFPDGCSVIRR